MSLNYMKIYEADCLRDVVAWHKVCKVANDTKLSTNCERYCAVTWKHTDAFCNVNSTAYPY